jgi:hypothetical protein
MDGGSPVFIGYRAKEAMPAFPSPDLLHFPPMPSHVRDFCSMCNCLRREAASIERSWEGFNCASCYDTVEAARASVDPAVGESYEVFGYRLFPVFIDATGNSTPFDFKRLLHCERSAFPPDPASGFESLSFDVLSFTPAIPCDRAVRSLHGVLRVLPALVQRNGPRARRQRALLVPRPEVRDCRCRDIRARQRGAASVRCG